MIINGVQESATAIYVILCIGNKVNTNIISRLKAWPIVLIIEDKAGRWSALNNNGKTAATNWRHVPINTMLTTDDNNWA